MGEIARFFGIIVSMYDDEHNPPHFHVRYAEQRASIVISTLEVDRGRLSPRVLALVLEWSSQHRRELTDNWERHAGRVATDEDSPSELIGPGLYPPEIIVRDVQYVRDFVILVRFADGFEREVDMKDELEGEVFQPLKDREFFRQVRFDSEIETAVWPNGADLAPEFLRWGAHLEHDCPCGH